AEEHAAEADVADQEGAERDQPHGSVGSHAMTDLRSVTVYCGSNAGADPAYAEATRLLARTLVDAGVRIVYGGAALGLMGVLADTAIEAGGEVIGVMPQRLIDREIGHRGLTELRVVSSMHE